MEILSLVLSQYYVSFLRWFGSRYDKVTSQYANPKYTILFSLGSSDFGNLETQTAWLKLKR